MSVAFVIGDMSVMLMLEIMDLNGGSSALASRSC